MESVEFGERNIAFLFLVKQDGFCFVFLLKDHLCGDPLGALSLKISVSLCE